MYEVTRSPCLVERRLQLILRDTFENKRKLRSQIRVKRLQFHTGICLQKYLTRHIIICMSKIICQVQFIKGVIDLPLPEEHLALPVAE